MLNKKLKTMTDYLGNIISAGMTIKVIRTKSIFDNITIHRPKKNGKGYFKPKSFKFPTDMWDCVREYEVYLGDNEQLWFKINLEDCTLHYPLSPTFVEFNMLSQPGDLITIKGVSDVKQKPD